MFLHELPVKDIRAALQEAYRVLKPGGLMLHMELPPNDALSPYDAFYLDWDAYYNNEPFYKAFRDQSYDQLCLDAGFAKDKLIRFVTPQYTYMDPDDFAKAVKQPHAVGENTGRLAAGIEWFGFGAWK
jgi:ubiquinone/menaquinone biosynthesis C-methylase UbiE